MIVKTLLVLGFFIAYSHQLNNGLGRTPQMGRDGDNFTTRTNNFLLIGWNSWNHFHCGVTENLVKETADALIQTGLAKVGYRYGSFS